MNAVAVVLIVFAIGLAAGFVLGFSLERLRDAFRRWNMRRRSRRYHRSNQ